MGEGHVNVGGTSPIILWGMCGCFFKKEQKQERTETKAKQTKQQKQKQNKTKTKTTGKQIINRVVVSHHTQRFIANTFSNTPGGSLPHKITANQCTHVQTRQRVP
jgi:hypothetical protein